MARKFTRFGSGVFAVAALCLTAGAAQADNAMVISIAKKMREQGMSQWRNGDFLSAYGNCFGARQMLLRLKDASKYVVADGVGYAELCMGLALHQMNIKSKSHDACRLLVQAQKNFKLVDELRKSQGETAEDGGYLAEMLKERGCRG